jgi:hypothetical protein
MPALDFGRQRSSGLAVVGSRGPHPGMRSCVTQRGDHALGFGAIGLMGLAVRGRVLHRLTVWLVLN